MTKITNPEAELLRQFWSLCLHDVKNIIQTILWCIELALKTELLQEETKDLIKVLDTYESFFKHSELTTMTLKQIIDKVNDLLGKITKVEVLGESEMELGSFLIPIIYNLARNSQKHSGRQLEDLVMKITKEGSKIIFTDNGEGVGDKNIFASQGDALTIIKKMEKTLGFSIKETGTQGARFEIDLVDG